MQCSKSWSHQSWRFHARQNSRFYEDLKPFGTMVTYCCTFWGSWGPHLFARTCHMVSAYTICRAKMALRLRQRQTWTICGKTWVALVQSWQQKIWLYGQLGRHKPLQLYSRISWNLISLQGFEPVIIHLKSALMRKSTLIWFDFLCVDCSDLSIDLLFYLFGFLNFPRLLWDTQIPNQGEPKWLDADGYWFLQCNLADWKLHQDPLWSAKTRCNASLLSTTDFVFRKMVETLQTLGMQSHYHITR